MLFFVQNLWNLMYILYLQRISNWTSHISSAFMAMCGWLVTTIWDSTGKDHLICYLYSLVYILGTSDTRCRTENTRFLLYNWAHQPKTSSLHGIWRSHWQSRELAFSIKPSLSVYIETLRWIQAHNWSFQTSGLISNSYFICLPGLKNSNARKEQRERNERTQLGEDSREWQSEGTICGTWQVDALCEVPAFQKLNTLPPNKTHLRGHHWLLQTCWFAVSGHTH